MCHRHFRAAALIAAVFTPTLYFAAQNESAANAIQNSGLSRAVNVPSIPMDNLEQYISQLHQRGERRKVDIIGQAMKFTPDQAAKFWPPIS